MVRIGSITFVISFLISSYGLAGSLAGELNKNKGSSLETFVYSLVASGNDIPDNPEFPSVDGLEVQSGGVSENYQNINGVASRSRVFRFALNPTRPGRFEIPPIKLMVDGEVLATLPLTLTVEQAKPAQVEDNPEIRLERSFSKSEVYVGEPFVKKIKVFRRVNASNYQEYPTLPASFDVKEIKGERTFRQVFGQYQYEVSEFARVITPKEAGTFDLPPAKASVHIPDNTRRGRRDPFSFFGNRATVQKILVSKAHTVVVKPLPTQGRPLGFSGLVGEFEAQASLSSRSLKTGDTATLTIQIQGKGNVAGMKEPLVKFPASIKVYDDKPETKSQADRTQGLVSRRTFRFALVPTKVGEFKLEESTVWIFNTRSGKYEALKVDLGAINVSQGEVFAESSNQIESTSVKKEAVKTLGEDILGIHRDEGHSRSQSIKGFRLALVSVAPGVAFVFAFSGFVFRRRHSSREERSRLRRVSKAHSDFKKAVSSYKKKEGGSPLFLNAESAFKQFLGNKFLLTGSALTADDAIEHLRKKGLDASAVDRVKELLAKGDSLRYGGATLSPNEVLESIEGFEKAAEEVDKKC